MLDTSSAWRAGKGSEIGDYLTTHPKVNCVSFTGGDTGISICKKGGMTPYQMELGGKDACIVCADADLDLAAKNIVKVALASRQLKLCQKQALSESDWSNVEFGFVTIHSLCPVILD